MQTTAAANERIVVIGAGPTGLGAAHRLHSLGHVHFDLYEAAGHPGGLASSVVDDKGFVWDLGGHVQFSHYDYFRQLMDDLLGDAWVTHERVASIHIGGRLVGYPLQHHIQELPPAMAKACVDGLASRDQGSTPRDFHAWILQRFGAGLAEHFMVPYNDKVWVHPLTQMSHAWVGDRVAPPRQNAAPRTWGPNRTFRFPQHGGTGEVWRQLASRIPPQHIHYHRRVVCVLSEERIVVMNDGSRVPYDRLISTMPLDELVTATDIRGMNTRGLAHSSVHVIGVGLQGQPPPNVASQCWMYFPGDDCPFYRATVFSNYAAAHVPDPSCQWSLMLEVAESGHRPLDRAHLEANVVDGLLRTGLIESRESIVSLWRAHLEHGYPIPTLGRDDALARLLPALECHRIYSRGRFGAWKYEVSNQDHSLMQGVELVDRLLLGHAEKTLPDPSWANAPGSRPWPSEGDR